MTLLLFLNKLLLFTKATWLSMTPTDPVEYMFFYQPFL